MPPEPASPRVAVAIPCYNEAAAIVSVVSAWRAALPKAEIVVFDNNSSDNTGDLARGLGVRVVSVQAQGKGHAVQAIFSALRDRDAVVLVDGDGTYPADAIPQLLKPVLDGQVDMTVGARQPVAEAGAMTPVRGLGNFLIRGAFRVLIGQGPGDLLSGYRVFGPRFLTSIVPHSSGFEIETELAAAAVAHRMRTRGVPVSYHPRIAGTTSKLRVVRDGWRILVTILRESVKQRPGRLLALLGVVVVVFGLLVWLVR